MWRFRRSPQQKRSDSLLTAGTTRRVTAVTRAVGFTKEQFHYAFANTLSREDSDEVYERYHIPAPGSFVWAGPLANFTPGHQDVYVNFRNEDRAPLLFIAGGEDNLMPPAVNQSNAKHYRHTNSITDYKEFPGRSHY